MKLKKNVLPFHFYRIYVVHKYLCKLNTFAQLSTKKKLMCRFLSFMNLNYD